MNRTRLKLLLLRKNIRMQCRIGNSLQLIRPNGYSLLLSLLPRILISLRPLSLLNLLRLSFPALCYTKIKPSLLYIVSPYFLLRRSNYDFLLAINPPFYFTCKPAIFPSIHLYLHLLFFFNSNLLFLRICLHQLLLLSIPLLLYRNLFFFNL